MEACLEGHGGAPGGSGATTTKVEVAGAVSADASSSVLDAAPLSVLLSAEFRRLADLLADGDRSGVGSPINVRPKVSAAPGGHEGLLLLYANDPVHRCLYIALEPEVAASVEEELSSRFSELKWIRPLLQKHFGDIFDGDHTVTPLPAVTFRQDESEALRARYTDTAEPGIADLLRAQRQPEKQPTLSTKEFTIEHAQSAAELALVHARYLPIQGYSSEAFDKWFAAAASPEQMQIANAIFRKWLTSISLAAEVEVCVPGTRLGRAVLYVFTKNEVASETTTLQKAMQTFLESQKAPLEAALRMFGFLRARQLLEAAFPNGSDKVEFDLREALVESSIHCLIGAKPLTGEVHESLRLVIGGRDYDTPIHLQQTERYSLPPVASQEPIVRWQVDAIVPNHVRSWRPLLTSILDWINRDPSDFYVDHPSHGFVDQSGAYPLALVLLCHVANVLIETGDEHLSKRHVVAVFQGHVGAKLDRSAELTKRWLTEHSPFNFQLHPQFTSRSRTKSTFPSYEFSPHKFDAAFPRLATLIQSKPGMVPKKTIRGNCSIVNKFAGDRLTLTQVVGNQFQRHHAAASKQLSSWLNDLGLSVDYSNGDSTVVTYIR
jgi:hypothetical protein